MPVVEPIPSLGNLKGGQWTTGGKGREVIEVKKERMDRAKRREMWAGVSLLLLAMVLLADGAQAQTLRRRDPDKWEFSAFGGLGTLAGQSQFLTQIGDGASSTVRLDAGSGWVVGMRISENLSNSFAAEFEYSIKSQPMTALGLAEVVPSTNLDQRIHNFTYNGLIYPMGRRGRVRPFAALGAGASLFQVSSKAEQAGIAVGLDLVDRWKFALTWGGGVKFRMGGPWGFRLDFRDNITAVPDYGIPRSSQLIGGVLTPAFRPDGQFHSLQFSAGFIYFFQPK